MSRREWTPEEALRHLAEHGIVWSIGQIGRQAERALNRTANRHKAMWPYYTVGTIQKTCWTAREASA